MEFIAEFLDLRDSLVAEKISKFFLHHLATAKELVLYRTQRHLFQLRNFVIGQFAKVT